MLSKIIKQEVKHSSAVCPLEGFKSMGVKSIKTHEICKLLVKVRFILMGNYSTI